MLTKQWHLGWADDPAPGTLQLIAKFMPDYLNSYFLGSWLDNHLRKRNWDRTPDSEASPVHITSPLSLVCLLHLPCLIEPLYALDVQSYGSWSKREENPVMATCIKWAYHDNQVVACLARLFELIPHVLVEREEQELAMDIAVTEGDPDVVKFLLERGVSPSPRRLCGHAALPFQSAEIGKLLVNAPNLDIAQEDCDSARLVHALAVCDDLESLKNHGGR
jgi:hypothetical protein